MIVKIRNKKLSLTISLAWGDNNDEFDISRVYAYANLVKAKDITLLAESKIAELNAKDKVAEQLA